MSNSSKDPTTVRLTPEQFKKLSRIAVRIAPKGTKPTPAMAVRWLIEKEAL